ncbi:CPBP family intramembrane glutamic endopeptidase [Aquibacillus sediminis]|uniref:CPBP family intramembrane glutamic endopeptidase n=1 Tax=Aquibacillus sediminis TaxID=2574734 RepID=UPI0011085975|nr:type II CAAX endopeptidase family protein [Aquibacillus sediminis]
MFKNSSGQVRAGWMILLALIVMFAAQGLFMVPGFVLFDLLQTTTTDMMSGLDRHPWIALIIQGGGTFGGLLMTLMFWRFVNKRAVKEIGFNKRGKDLLFGLLLGAASITAIFLLLFITGNVELLNRFSAPEFSTYTITFFILFILVGFFEEIFFRGYVMSTMVNRGNSKWLVYIVSALLFSVVHGTNPNVSLFGLINILLVGLLFAYMFDVTKSLWLAIGYHITWNYFQGNVFGFAVSGTVPHGIYNVDVSNGNDWLTGGSFGLEGGLLATIFILLGFVVTNWYVKWQKVANSLF